MLRWLQVSCSNAHAKEKHGLGHRVKSLRLPGINTLGWCSIWTRIQHTHPHLTSPPRLQVNVHGGSLVVLLQLGLPQPYSFLPAQLYATLDSYTGAAATDALAQVGG